MKNKKALDGKRTSARDWPELEAALFEWQQRMQGKKAIISGDILKAQALKFWNVLPQFADVPEPKWSNGWLDRFKGRFKIKEYVQHSEAASADINSPGAIRQIEYVQTLALEYKPRNVLNMDETGLF